jgi:cystathionine gamma-synthase
MTATAAASLFDSLAKRGCYRVLFVDQNDEQALRAALAEKPKLVLVESPSNPLLRVDIAKICSWRVRPERQRGG